MQLLLQLFLTEDNCTVTPKNPILLTAIGGRLYDGMTNVKVNCNCTNQNPEDILWYYPNGTRFPPQSISIDSPHVKQQNGTLIIPRFSQLNEGTYYCWANGSSFGSHTTFEMLRGK